MKTRNKSSRFSSLIVCLLLSGIQLYVASPVSAAPVLVWGQDHWGHSVWASNDPKDWDGDSIANKNDAFPYDGAASIDTDGDGYADEWNAGADANQIETASVTIDDDDDNDGFSDTFEIDWGSDPKSFDDIPRRGILSPIIFRKPSSVREGK